MHKPRSIIIIGGGINGAGIARDAAMRGLHVTLFEKGDFCSGTSWASSKLIHGGLRYLEHGELGLVRESLRERSILMHMHPDLIKPLRIVLPVYQQSPRGLMTMRFGLAMYDWLAGGHAFPHHASLSMTEMTRMNPHLQTAELKGGVAYYDGQCVFPERMVIANLRSAADHGARIHNYHKVESLLLSGNRIQGVSVKNMQTGNTREVSADLVVNAAGPWLDEILHDKPRLIGGTKGSHIVVANTIGLDHGLYVQARSDGRPFFILPWRDRIMIGTTDIRFEGNPDDLKPSEAEIDYLTTEARHILPTLPLGRESILMSFAGVRPLAHSPNNSEAAITRRHRIMDHKLTDRIDNMISLVGGKLTTYRHASEQVVDVIEAKLGLGHTPCTTAKVPIAEPVVHDPVEHAITHEWALHLDDIMFRRTGLGYVDDLGLGQIADVADRAAALLGWDASTKRSEIDAYRRHISDDLLSHRRSNAAIPR